MLGAATQDPHPRTLHPWISGRDIPIVRDEIAAIVEEPGVGSGEASHHGSSGSSGSLSSSGPTAQLTLAFPE